MVKECIYLLLFMVAFASGLVCWNCHNAPNMRKCRKEGKFDVCSTDQNMCVTEVRKHSGRQTINKGCQQDQSCMTQMKQNNMMMDSKNKQCNGSPNSVCCCCCKENKCNKYKNVCGPKRKIKSKSEKKDKENKSKRRKQSKNPSSNSSKRTLSNCPPMSPVFPHGEVKCHKSVQRKRVICDFECTEEGYTLFPRHDSTLSCLPSGEWNGPKPCCGPKCENPQYDIIAMTNAGSNETYEKMYELFDHMFKRLARDPGIQHAHVEFSGRVTFTQNFKEVTTKPEEHHNLTVDHTHINTEDGNTNIGAALSAVHYTLGHEGSGNRKDVRDVILLAIDKDSDDDFLKIGAIWQEEHAMILILAFPRDGEYPSDPNLAEITLDDHHVYQYRDGSAQEVAYYIAEDLENHSCVNPCIADGHDH